MLLGFVFFFFSRLSVYDYKYAKQDLFFSTKIAPELWQHYCICIRLLQVYDQSVVISQSFHVLLTLIILCWFLFFFDVLIFLLKIYGIKCTGSVSSAFVSWDVIVKLHFPFSLSLSLCLSICFCCSYRRGICSQQCCCRPCYGINNEHNSTCTAATAARWEGWGGRVWVRVMGPERRKK